MSEIKEPLSDPDSESQELDTSDVPETDILFECPNCGKSLSIDPRGAGLVIRCTQCGDPVVVPIPEGMEIDDFDATPEELSMQLLHTRQALSKAQARVEELETEVAVLLRFKEEAERRASAHAEEAALFRRAVAGVREAQSEATRALDDLVSRAEGILARPPGT